MKRPMQEQKKLSLVNHMYNWAYFLQFQRRFDTVLAMFTVKEISTLQV